MKRGLLYIKTIAAVILVIIINPACVNGQAATDSLPSYISPACSGYPLRRMTHEEMQQMIIPVVRSNPSITQASQLKVFNELVNILDSDYLYPDFKGLNWPVYVSGYRERINKGLVTDSFYRAMENFIRGLGDNHSSFESPLTVATNNAILAGKNDFVGVGALFLPLQETKHVTVLAVMPGSPAEHAGLQPHDIILDVDGLPLIQDNKVYPYTRGPECSLAILNVQKPGKEPHKIPIVRSRVSGRLPVYARLVPDTDGKKIGYIFIPTFFDLSVPEQVKKALQDLGELDGLILDNRMNGGGSSQVLFPMLSYFTSGNMGQFINRYGRRPMNITAAPVANSQKVPLVVLVSKNTVSYGEVFSGILQDIGRAVIIGETTAGRVETLHGYSFSDGSKAWIATERFEPVKTHINWQVKGVKPDMEIISHWDQFTFETDPALAVALKVFLKH